MGAWCDDEPGGLDHDKFWYECDEIRTDSKRSRTAIFDFASAPMEAHDSNECSEEFLDRI